MEIAKNSLIRTFGRMRGKKLSARQQWLIDNLLPQLVPSAQCPVPENCKAILEIGFGAGEHILHLAENNPTTKIIGAEPFINGIASMLAQMTDEKNNIKPEYKNIRIWPDDVRKLLSLITCHLSLVYILHPDPWPKARHEKRRLLSAEFLNGLAGRLVPGGQIIIATDHLDYFDWILEQVKNSKLKIQNSKLDVPPESGLDTRYKNKDMFGANTCRYLVLGAN